MTKEHDRRPFDFYETPPHYTAALRAAMPMHHREPRALKGKAYEPCVGNGAIVAAFPTLTWTTNDWDGTRTADTHFNAARHRAWGDLGYKWCITNPPFNAILPILTNALQFCPHVAMLARLSILEPTEDRAPFWDRHGDSIRVIVLPRYSFRNNDAGKKGSDTMTCCWIVRSSFVEPGITWAQVKP